VLFHVTDRLLEWWEEAYKTGSTKHRHLITRNCSLQCSLKVALTSHPLPATYYHFHAMANTDYCVKLVLNTEKCHKIFLHVIFNENLKNIFYILYINLVNKLATPYILLRGGEGEFSKCELWFAFLLPVRYLYVDSSC
jgi:hypothetical protein